MVFGTHCGSWIYYYVDIVNGHHKRRRRSNQSIIIFDLNDFSATN